MDFSIETHRIKVIDNESISAEVYLPASPKAVFVFAHGAGAGMNHVFMAELSQALASEQIITLRYNFLYMEQKKKRPDFPAVAHQAVAASVTKAIELFPGVPLFAGGKSFGGRMTSQLLASVRDHNVKGIIFVGFPLHPARKPSVDRADHLRKIETPMLFLQGTKDALAELSLLEGVCNSLPLASLVTLDGADHAFKMPKQKAIPLLSAHISSWVNQINQ